MINLPPHPFKVTGVDEADPFVAKALRGRKHFEPCWCGSGKKYKKCHKTRGLEKPYTLGQLLHLQQKIFWQQRGCMHPLASVTTCSGKIIDSHSIQRKGPLEHIVDKTGHVMHFEPSSTVDELKVKKIGWRKASVFPGYCSGHDSSLFGPLENEDFTGEHQQCVLQAFRNVCNELYRKQALVEALEFQRDFIDRGRELDDQINLQMSFYKSIEGQKKSLDELRNLRAKFETVIVNGEYDLLQSRCLFFRGELEVVSSSVFQCEFDFEGNKLVDMWDLNIDAQLLSHSIMDTNEGGAIVFVWPTDESDPGTVAGTFIDLPNDEKGDIFVQYCIVNCENTFFAQSWWENLGEKEKALIRTYANTLFYEGGKFVANENRLVNWSFA